MSAVAGLFAPLELAHGPRLANRFMLAPLTNCQSHDDGRLSDDEFRWLTMRAQGGFGLTMTCAAHVQAAGQGFPGQLGIFGDQHLPGLSRLAAAIKAQGSSSADAATDTPDQQPSPTFGDNSLAAADSDDEVAAFANRDRNSDKEV